MVNVASRFVVKKFVRKRFLPLFYGLSISGSPSLLKYLAIVKEALSDAES